MSWSGLCLATGQSLAVRIDPVVPRAALSPHWLHDAFTIQLSIAGIMTLRTHIMMKSTEEYRARVCSSDATV